MPSHKERAHSNVGASSAYRWMACPGSVPLLERFPMPSSEAADYGTKAHELSELLLADDDVDYDNYDAEMLENIREYVMWIEDLMTVVARETGQQPTLVVEKRFNLKSVHEFAFGTNDIAIICGDVLHIIDLKYGQNFVDVEDNPQLMYYALGIIEEMDLKPKEVRLWVYGPRFGMEYPSQHWKPSKKRLAEFHKELQKAAQRVQDEPDTYVQGDHCMYCNKAACPLINKVSSDMFDDIQPIVTVEGENVDLLKHMETDELVKWHNNREVMEGFLRDITSILRQRAIDGESVPGHKLVQSYGHRRLDEGAGEVDVATELKLKVKDITETRLKSAAQIEKVLHKAYPARKKADRAKRKEMQTKFDSMTHKPERGLKFVPSDHKGEAFLPLIAEVEDIPDLPDDLDLDFDLDDLNFDLD